MISQLNCADPKARVTRRAVTQVSTLPTVTVLGKSRQISAWVLLERWALHRPSIQGLSTPDKKSSVSWIWQHRPYKTDSSSASGVHTSGTVKIYVWLGTACKNMWCLPAHQAKLWAFSVWPLVSADQKYPTTITCYQITNLDVHPTKSDRCWSTPIHRNCYDWVIRRPLPSPRQGRHLGPPEVWNLLLSAYNAYKSSWHAQPRRQQAPQGQINGFSWAFKPAVCEPFNA